MNADFLFPPVTGHGVGCGGTPERLASSRATEASWFPLRSACRALIAAGTAATTLFFAGCASTPKPPAPAPPVVLNAPAAPREFRAVWVATVNNIDWPSKPGLPAAQQRAEILAILDQAKALNLNAVIFQVRPAADALYASPLEPWSEYLTGTQGKNPGYDPLAVWIEEAHRRGLELHAWFNPYRARHQEAKSPLAATHLSKTHPAVVKRYGELLWMDPGEEIASARTLAVVRDVVKRYDLDGVHIDDYFYPYPILKPLPKNAPKDAVREEVDFPDEPAWKRYVKAGGKLSRHDWRRHNVDELVEKIYAAIHAEKPWVKFGISPFGLGRPDRRPPGIKGFSQYDKLYADVELWVEKGWLDYLTPQLYWKISQKEQAFAPLLAYWADQNKRGRHLWPGLFTSKISDASDSWLPEEIVNQIAVARGHPAASGHVHFSMIALTQNRRGIADQLAPLYPTPALVPATPWLKVAVPPAPRLIRQGGVVQVDGLDAGASRLAIWRRQGETWRFSVQPAARPTIETADDLVISVVNRAGVEGPRASLPAGPAPKNR